MSETPGSIRRLLPRWWPARVGQCPPAEHLSDLAAGTAGPLRRRRLSAHLSGCPDCAGDYQVLTRARDGLSAALESFAPEDRRAPGVLQPRIAGLAAAAVAGAMVFGVLVYQGSVPPESPGRAGVEPAAETVPESGTIFASRFESEPAGGANGNGAEGEVLFRSDFDQTGASS